MIENCRERYDLTDPNYVSENTQKVEFIETEAGGAGRAEFSPLNGPALVLQSLESKTAPWIKEKRCADGAFFTFDNESVTMHICELKSVVTVKDFEKVKSQLWGMYLNSTAFAYFMHIRSITKVTCYLGMKEDRISTNPVLLKVLPGKPSPIPEWTNSEIRFPKGVRARLVRKLRDSAGDVHFGAV